MVVLLVTGGYDNGIRFWDAPSGICYKSLSHAEKQVNCLAISPEKTHIVAGGNPTIRLYDVNAKGADPLLTFEGHTNNVTGIGYQRDGRWMYSCSEDGSVRIWDPRASVTSQRDYESSSSSSSSNKTTTTTGGVSSVALHPNQGELMSGEVSGTIRIWDLTANKCATELVPEGDTPISSVTIASDASVAVAANYNGNLYAWSPRAPPLLTPPTALPPPSMSSASSASSSFINDPGTSYYYTPLSKKISAHRAYILSAKLSPDAKLLATASSDRTVKLWNMSPSSGSSSSNNSNNNSNNAAAAAANPTNSASSSASDGVSAAGTSTTTTNNVSGASTGGGGGDGNNSAAADWSLHSTLQGHSRWVWDVSWSADSSYVVSVSSDCSARLWEVSTGDVVRQYSGHNKAITAVALNDSAVISGGGGGGTASTTGGNTA